MGELGQRFGAWTGGAGAQPERRVWRLIMHDRNGARWNMAVDESILEAVGIGISPPTLRFYRWETAAITLGRFQDVERSVNVPACRRMGIALTRRPTGGRAVLHEEDETASVVVPEAILGADGSSVVRSYAALARGYAAGLFRMGLAAAAGSAERRSAQTGDCFALRSPADLIGPDGAKLIGSAQCRRAGVILQQASIRHRPGTIEPREVFLGPPGPAAYPLAGVSMAMMREALTEGLAGALGAVFQPGELSAWEHERAGALMERAEPRTRVDRQTAV